MVHGLELQLAGGLVQLFAPRQLEVHLLGDLPLELMGMALGIRARYSETVIEFLGMRLAHWRVQIFENELTFALRLIQMAHFCVYTHTLAQVVGISVPVPRHRRIHALLNLTQALVVLLKASLIACVRVVALHLAVKLTLANSELINLPIKI